jgi:hypothetical protein
MQPAIDFLTRIFPAPRDFAIRLWGGTVPAVTGPRFTLVITAPAGDNLVAVHAPSVLLADEGRIELATARNATLQLRDGADAEDAVPTSLWQNNLVAVRCIRCITWRRRSSSAVAVVSDVDWSAPVV